MLQLVPSGGGAGTGDESEAVIPPQDDPGLGPNERALIRTLRQFGHEEDGDAARWQMLRSLARAVDTAPSKAALWKEYREALDDLKKDAADADKSLQDAVEALRQASD